MNDVLTFMANAAVLLIALLHLWFCVLEMFLWQKPPGLKIFKIEAEFAKRSAPLAANQGLYNSFLSAGLLWSLFSGDPSQALHLKIFFLSCVILAGIYGGMTVNTRIFFVQAVPAVITFFLLGLSASGSG